VTENDLDSLSSKELHDRAVQRAVDHKDVKFLWRLLREIPAAEAATGNTDAEKADLLHVAGLLHDFTHADENELADALRPVYIEYLAKG
jgi:hypothetical protein